VTRWVYSLLLLALHVAALPWFIYRAIFLGKRCPNWRQRWGGRIRRRAPQDSRLCVWLHAVSVGEVNLLKPVVAELLRREPETHLAISVTTGSGMQLARQLFGQHQLFFAPIDFHWSVQQVLKRLRPDLIVLSELELWPNLIGVPAGRGIPVAVINARLGDNSYRGYRRFDWLLRPQFQNLSLVAAQNRTFADRFAQLGTDPKNIRVTGSVKFDNAQLDRHTALTGQFRELIQWSDQDRIFLAGSTQPGEEILAARAFQRIRRDFPRLRLIVAPRHVDRANAIAGELRSSGLVVRRRNSLLPLQPLRQDEVLLIDTIGELASWWGLADIGFVGGSFGDRGGQNMLEPVALGVATCFGPNTRNFQQIVSTLLDHQAAVQLHTADELDAFVRRCLDDPTWTLQLANNGRQLVTAQQGASQLTAELLSDLVDRQPTHKGGSQKPLPTGDLDAA